MCEHYSVQFCTASRGVVLSELISRIRSPLFALSIQIQVLLMLELIHANVNQDYSVPQSLVTIFTREYVKKQTVSYPKCPLRH